jgi:hypothetical protein
MDSLPIWAIWSTIPGVVVLAPVLAFLLATATGGAWMVVEPMAGDRLEDNLNPGGDFNFASRSGHHTPICAFSCPRVGSSLPLIPRKAD